MELDAVIMEGKSMRCGAVGGLQGFKFVVHISHHRRSAISVARKVLENSPHTFIVGEGAQKFALSQGFTLEDNLSENSRKSYEEYLKSKE